VKNAREGVEISNHIKVLGDVVVVTLMTFTIDFRIDVLSSSLLSS